jgi:hypothetical protein
MQLKLASWGTLPEGNARSRGCDGGSAEFCSLPKSSITSTARLSLLLAPYLKMEHHWTNTDYANIVVAFRVAHAIPSGPSVGLLDRT